MRGGRALLRAAMSGAVVIALVFAARPASAGVSRGETDLKHYGHAMCIAIATYVHETRRAKSTLHEAGTRMRERRAALVAYLRRLESAAKKLAHRLEQAGIPKVKGGWSFADAFVNAVRQLGSQFGLARIRAQVMRVDDREEFARVERAIATSLKRAGREFKSNVKRATEGLNIDALSKSAKKDPACSKT